MIIRTNNAVAPLQRSLGARINVLNNDAPSVISREQSQSWSSNPIAAKAKPEMQKKRGRNEPYPPRRTLNCFHCGLLYRQSGMWSRALSSTPLHHKKSPEDRSNEIHDRHDRARAQPVIS